MIAAALYAAVGLWLLLWLGAWAIQIGLWLLVAAWRLMLCLVILIAVLVGLCLRTVRRLRSRRRTTRALPGRLAPSTPDR